MIERHLRQFLLDKPAVRNLVGNAIYAGRIPERESPALAILITRNGTSRHYDLSQEDGIVATDVGLEFVGKSSSAAYQTWQAAEEVRKAISVFRGFMGRTFEQIWIYTVRISRDFQQEPVWLPSVSKWSYIFSMDLEIVHAQTLVTTPA